MDRDRRRSSRMEKSEERCGKIKNWGILSKRIEEMLQSNLYNLYIVSIEIFHFKKYISWAFSYMGRTEQFLKKRNKCSSTFNASQIFGSKNVHETHTIVKIEKILYSVQKKTVATPSRSYVVLFIGAKDYLRTRMLFGFVILHNLEIRSFAFPDSERNGNSTIRVKIGSGISYESGKPQ